MLSMYVDYTGRISSEDLGKAGITGVFRYLSWMNYWGGVNHPNPNPKIILHDEYQALTEAGIDVILNWEFDPRDWLDGGPAGQLHGKEAVNQAGILGYPRGKPIPGSADFNMLRTDWDNAAKAYAEAYAHEIMAGGYVPGVYGPWDVLQWVHDECPQFQFFWQAGMSTSWSNGKNAEPHPLAHFRQVSHATIGGVDCDVNEILRDYRVTGEGFMALSDQDQQNMLDAVTRIDGAMSKMDNTPPFGYGGGGALGQIGALVKALAGGGAATLSDAQYADLKAAVLAQLTPEAIARAILGPKQ